MKKYIIFASFFIAFVFNSCKNEMEIINPNQATASNFWKSPDDAIKGVNAVYSTLHRTGISRWMPFYLIVRSDEGQSTSPWNDLKNNSDQFIITDYNFGVSYDIWNDNYIGIFRANQVIANVGSIDMDETLKNRLVGEAKFLRAMFYYHLVTLWGNVPLMLHPSLPADKPSNATIAEVYTQIEKDLTEAVADLPETYGDADLGRATKGAANALLAKAMMQQHKYTEALTPLKWLCEDKGKDIYSLMANYRDNFILAKENNKESVFEWQFAQNLAENTDNDINPNNNYGSSLAQFFGPSSIGWSDGEANRWPVWEFLKEKTLSDLRDPRLDASFLYDSTDVRGPKFSMIYGQTFFARYGNSNKRVWFRKFQNDNWKNEEGYRSPNNWRYIRYADVLLMYSECLNEAGQTSKAYQYVDMVRQRAGLAKLSVSKPNLSKTDFLTQLKHERVTELSGEGHRWMDLARWGSLGPQLGTIDPGFNNFVVGKSELLPIPQQEIDINPNLKQNSLW